MRRLLCLTLLALATVPAAAEAAFPGANGAIAVSRSTPSGAQLWTMQPGGGAQAPLTAGSPDLAPAYSANGQQVAFTRSGRLWVVDADGSDPGLVPVPPGPSLQTPAWSPDGDRLVFAADFGFRLLYTVAPDGTGLQQVPVALSDPSDPAWSPDGDWLAVAASGAGGQRDLFMVRPDGTSLTQLTATAGVDESAPDWSPDGTRLAYERDAVDVWTLTVAGGAAQDLGSGNRPAWSPDGAKIAATRPAAYPAAGVEVTVRPSGGGAVTPITSGAASDADVSWQPLVSGYPSYPTYPGYPGPPLPGTIPGGSGGTTAIPPSPTAPVRPSVPTNPGGTARPNPPAVNPIGADFLKKLLRRLRSRLARLRAQGLLRGITLGFRAPAAGVVDVRITSIGTAQASRAGRVLVLATGRMVVGAGRAGVPIRATKRGRRYLRRHQRKPGRVRVTLGFKPAGQARKAVTTTVRLRRR